MISVKRTAGGPGGGVGALERVLLAGGAEDPPESVDDEVDAQQQRDDRERQRRGPEIPPESSVEQTGGHEAARQHRVVEALDTREPRTVVGGGRVESRLRAGAHHPGAHQHPARAGTGLAGEVHGATHGHPARLQQAHDRGVALGDRQHRHDLGVVPVPEGSERGYQLGVVPQHDGRLGLGGATGHHETAAQDHGARALPVLEPAGDFPAGRPRAVRRFEGEQEVADDLDPAAERHVDDVVHVRGRAGSFPHVDVARHATSIVTSPGGSHPSPNWVFPSPERGREPR